MVKTYETDFVGWSEQQAQLLREHRWHDLDLEHLIEEVSELGKSQRDAITSQLVRIMIHLLKWEHQPGRRSRSWEDSISDGRIQIELLLDSNPGLKHHPEAALAKAYTKAQRYAARETGLPLDCFPSQCPYAIEQLLEPGWLPG